MRNEIQHLFCLAVLQDSAILACFTKCQMPVETSHPRFSLLSYKFIVADLLLGNKPSFDWVKNLWTLFKRLLGLAIAIVVSVRFLGACPPPLFPLAIAKV